MPARIIPASHYSKAAVRGINAARHSVYLATFTLQPDPATDDIVTALIRAAHRGVVVDVIADVSTFGYIGASFRIMHAKSTTVRRLQVMALRLASAGVHLHWVGNSSPFFYAGRTHVKWLIADDSVLSFGGINLDSTLGSTQDYMLALTDKRIADIVRSEHRAIIRADALGTANISTSYDTTVGTVLVDGGLIGDSLIYRRAVKHITNAQSVLLVTQYCPSGALATALHRIPHQLYYNPPHKADFLTKLLIIATERQFHLASQYQREPYLHAKFLIATSAHGQKTAIAGSHNFISYGGLLGTREIALETSDPAIIHELEQYYHTYIA